MPPPHTATTPSETLPAAPPRRRFRWLWWLGGIVLLLGVLVAVALWQLDPWLRRTLEKQVAEKSNGRYQLRIGGLETNFKRRSITLRNLRLRPTTARASDSLPAPWLVLDVARLHVGGIGIGALLRKEIVPVDSLAIETVRARVLNTPDDLGQSGPLHKQLPKRLAGIRLAHLNVTDVRVSSGPVRNPSTQLRQGSLRATDILVSREGSADARRLGYAATVELRAAGLQALVPGHTLELGSGYFSSKGKRLTLDSLRIEPRAAGRKAGAARTALWLPQLAVSGLRTKLLGRRLLLADTLRLAAPRLTFTLPATPPPPPHEVLAPYLRRVQLKELRVTNGWLRLHGTDKAPTVQRIVISANDVRVDTAGYRDTRRVLYARAWDVRTGPTQLTLDAPYYRLSYQNMHLASRPGTLRLADVLLKPAFSLHAMARRKRHQVSHITLKLPRFQASGLDYGSLTRNQALRVQAVTLSGARLDVKGNSKYPINPKPSVVTPESIRKLPFPVDIRQLRIANANMYFTFLGKQAVQNGNVQIRRFNGTATNLSNSPKRMAQPAIVKASGYLQNQCYMQATGWFPLREPNGQHRIVGRFGPAPFAILNSITVPTRYVRFEEGQVQGVRFEGSFNRQEARGTMQVRYTDLKLEYLSRKFGAQEKETLVTKVKSKLVNGIVIRDNNPRKGELQIGTMQSRREPRYSVFALWQQGLISGMLNSFGVPRKMATSISEQ
ncbi:hypothetical protein [Hymenobacter koreensis]|uniref:DUF748 domain-containing protein n=1 Tax=Hymenobacter koreensis TaxID=1084523 RepID=A0ABP8J3U4_9BACT